MGFLACIAYGFIGYFDFGSRSSRAEFWWWQLFANAIYLGILVFEYHANGPSTFESFEGRVPGMVFSVLAFFPTLAVGCRRLHDIDKSGWWQLLLFVPVVGLIILIIWFARAGDPNPNSYGDDPFCEVDAFA